MDRAVLEEGFFGRPDLMPFSRAEAGRQGAESALAELGLRPVRTPARPC